MACIVEYLHEELDGLKSQDVQWNWIVQPTGYIMLCAETGAARPLGSRKDFIAVKTVSTH